MADYRPEILLKHIYVSLYATQKQNIKCYIYVFDVHLSNRSGKNVERLNRKWEIQDGGHQNCICL